MNIAIWVVVVSAAFAGVVVLLMRQEAAKRRRAFEGFAGETGWRFDAEQRDPRVLDMRPFPLFEKGTQKWAKHVVRGDRNDVTVAVFDYRYDESMGDSEYTEQTVVHVRSKRLSLPAFVLSPENVLHRIGNMFGYEDIDFDDTPDFSKHYLLRAKENEPRVREAFPLPVRVFFERRKPITMEADGDQLLIYHHDKLIEADRLGDYVEEATAIARQFMR